MNNLKECLQPELFLSMKLSIHSFIQTMAVYGYAGLHLNDLLFTLMDRFGELTRTHHDDIVLEVQVF